MPADVRLADGHIQLDQSTLTGESLPLEAGSGQTAFAGSVVIRGEASGEVIATGARTYFGKTAELVRTAKTVSHLQATIFTIVKYLVTLDAVLVVILLLYAWLAHLPMMDMLPFALILLVASVPVALPATFTLATALGSVELASSGVLGHVSPPLRKLLPWKCCAATKPAPSRKIASQSRRSSRMRPTQRPTSYGLPCWRATPLVRIQSTWPSWLQPTVTISTPQVGRHSN